MKLQKESWTMKNSITKKELENDLLYGTLQALHNCVSGMGLNLYVVGATARDLTMKLLDETAQKACDAVEKIISGNIDKAMNLYNS